MPLGGEQQAENAATPAAEGVTAADSSPVPAVDESPSVSRIFPGRLAYAH